MFGFQHNHHCGRRQGSRSWGPFTVEWEVGSDDLRHGRRRRFNGDELRLVLLKLIEDAPRHGYDLIRDIEDRTGGAYAPSPGVVYPTLTLLDDMGLIEEQKAEGARKLFAITQAGRDHLQERADEVAGLIERLAEIGQRRERSQRTPIRRAMANLRQVLHDRLAEESEADTLHDVAAIIDEAARKIERLA